MKKKIYLYLTLFFIFISTNTYAYTITFTSGMFSQIKIGDEFGTDWDIVTMNPITSDINLTINNPQEAKINDLIFSLGLNRNYPILVSNMNATRSLTINGVTQNISNPFQVDINLKPA
jgi:hypothetical protein